MTAQLSRGVARSIGTCTAEAAGGGGGWGWWRVERDMVASSRTTLPLGNLVQVFRTLVDAGRSRAGVARWSAGGNCLIFHVHLLQRPWR